MKTQRSRFPSALGFLCMLTWALSLPTHAAGQGAAIGQGDAMRIGLIGAGNMGGPLGLLLAEAGHQVVWASRNPDELMDLVQAAAPRATAGYADAAAYFSDVIVLAVPPSAVPQIGQDYGHLMQGKIVIDLTNPRIWTGDGGSQDRDGPISNEWLAMGTGLAMAQYLPGVRFVKAFNTLSSRMWEDAHRPGEPIGVPIAGDDPEAVSVAERLVGDVGFAPVIVGALERASEFDRGTSVWLSGMTARELRSALNLPGGAP